MRDLRETALGRGNYVAGGARTQPFLALDGARRRRPMVMGEVLADASACDPLAASMFSGRASDPAEWAVMWKELGADGVLLRVRGTPSEEAAALVAGISRRTGLPVAVDGEPDALRAAASAVSDSRMLLVGGDAPGHVCARRVRSADDAVGAEAVFVEGRFPDRSGFDLARDLRRRALDGDPEFDAVIVFDVTPSWPPGASDARVASMVEAEAALAAMLSGADIVFVRGPGAADMARVYGEELADL